MRTFTCFQKTNRISILLLTLILVFGVSKGVCQSYSVEYTFYNFDYTLTLGGSYSEIRYASADLLLASGEIVSIASGTPSAEGILILDSKPVELLLSSFYEYNDFGTVTLFCNESEIYSLSSYGDCYQYSYNNWFGGCSIGTLDFSVKPVLPITGSASGSYCENETITLDNTSGFNGGQWQYSVSFGVWENFYPGGNSVTFGVQNVFGGSYSSYLNQPIYFRYSYSGGSCDPSTNTSNALGPYNFSPSGPEVSTSDVFSPSCKDGTNAVIKISSLSRSVLSGETLTYTVYTPGNTFVAQTSSTQQPNAGSPIEIRGDNATTAPFGIAPGNYKILVESTESLCGTVVYYSVPTISNPTQVTFSPSPLQPSCYGGSNGSITVTASGGLGSGYTYSKDNGSTYQSDNSLNGLSVGDYTVKIKDGNGCPSGSSTVSVTQPVDINIASAFVTSDYNGRDISCVGSTNGQITITASGGTNPLSYAPDGTNFQAANIFNSLGAGNYNITVRDGNNCTKSSSSIPIVAPPAITATTTSTSATCNGETNGSIEVVNPQGGTGMLEYSINGTTFQSVTDFINLAANNYIVTIRDANLCTSAVNTAVSQPGAISVTPTPTLVTCAGGNDGAVTITATNTVGTATYSLNGGAFQASNSFAGLSTNTYTVTVKDGNGCLGNGNVTINSNPIITGSLAIVTSISCNGGSNGALNLTPSGGVGPYTFTWSNGPTTEDISALSIGTYSVTITDTKNCEQTFNRTLTQPLPVTVSAVASDFNGSGVSCFGESNGSVDITTTGGNGGYTYLWSNSSTTEDLTALSVGTYTVTATDNKGCLGNQSATITQPAPLILSINSAQNISCFDGANGSLTLNATGGTSDYEYSINNGSSWQSTTTFTNLTAATFPVLTRDENGCTDNDVITLTSPTELVLTLNNITNTTCTQSNGSATASASGGVSSYAFNWFNSGNVLVGSGNSISDLAAGVYHVEVVDQNSCNKQQNITISSSDGPAISIASVTPVTCSNTTDGSATITISQGQTPYTILWPNGQTTTTATYLAGGDYIVQVKDNTNCLSLQTVNVPAPAPLTIQTITQQNPNCFGTNDGALEVAAQGGNGTYTYSWNTGSTSTTLTNLIAGAYTVTAKDLKNCQAIQQFTLTDPPQFTIDLGANLKICEGQTITKASDVDSATYQWTGPNNFASTLQQILLTQPGVYALTVTNQNGCEATDSFELSFDTNLLKADFLMVSEAFVGDTIIVIDISWPLPSSVTWQFDQAAVVLDESPDFSLIRFDDPGQYNVSIMAQLAQCASSHSQVISIVENPNGRVGGRIGSENIISLLHVFPNPTTDRLTVEIELSEENRATVEIYNVQSNRRELSQVFKDDSFYKQDFKIGHFQSGLYVVVVKVGSEMKSVRVIKL